MAELQCNVMQKIVVGEYGNERPSHTTCNFALPLVLQFARKSPLIYITASYRTDVH